MKFNLCLPICSYLDQYWQQQFFGRRFYSSGQELPALFSIQIGISTTNGVFQPVSKSSIADKQVMVLRREITNMYISCSQVQCIIDCFKVGDKVLWKKIQLFDECMFVFQHGNIQRA